MLEDSGIKLSSIPTDITGGSGRAMLQALIEGEQDPAVLADLAKKGMRRKIPALTEALTGRLNAHHGIKSRRGPMKALVAVEHSILISIWHMLTTGEIYADLGPDFYTRRRPLRSKERAVQQLEGLGYHVTLAPVLPTS